MRTGLSSRSSGRPINNKNGQSETILKSESSSRRKLRFATSLVANHSKTKANIRKAVTGLWHEFTLQFSFQYKIPDYEPHTANSMR